MQYQLALIEHEVDKAIICQRASDGYVNATEMCKAVDKQFSDYSRSKNAIEFLDELSAVRGIPRTDLVITVKGGNPAYQGTWVHPDVAINLGQWCSPKFAVAVAQWVRDWLSGAVKAPLPPHIKRYMVNRSEIPSTHFSMLNEITFALVAPLEEQGYTLPEQFMPDISTGRLFSDWLRKKGHVTGPQCLTSVEC